MPTKPKISRAQILDGAFQLVRKQGVESLTARSLAQELGCSTQPILYQFADMRELEKAVYQQADDFHTAYLFRIASEENAILQIGMNYIRFAAEEPRLFHFLFQTNHFSGKSLEQMIDDPEVEPLIRQFAVDGNMAHAKHLLLMLFVWVHGYASLLAGNQIAYDPDALQSQLTELYEKLRSENS